MFDLVCVGSQVSIHQSSTLNNIKKRVAILGCMGDFGKAWIVICHWKVCNFCQKNYTIKGLQFWSIKNFCWVFVDVGLRCLNFLCTFIYFFCGCTSKRLLFLVR